LLEKVLLPHLECMFLLYLQPVLKILILYVSSTTFYTSVAYGNAINTPLNFTSIFTNHLFNTKKLKDIPCANIKRNGFSWMKSSQGIPPCKSGITADQQSQTAINAVTNNCNNSWVPQNTSMKYLHYFYQQKSLAETKG